jgi:outer membrane protein assembly factor BamE
MHVKARCRLRLALPLSMAALLTACSSISDTTRNAMQAITPYKMEIVQGNFVSREQVQALQPGMSRQQVREILGTPLVTSVFHGDRWEYVFTIERQGVAPQQRKLTVFFEGERYARSEGDEMPSETEFVATLGKPMRQLKVPTLQATDAQLARFPAASSKAPPATAPAANAAQRSYPPLETAP